MTNYFLNITRFCALPYELNKNAFGSLRPIHSIQSIQSAQLGKNLGNGVLYVMARQVCTLFFSRGRVRVCRPTALPCAAEPPTPEPLINRLASLEQRLEMLERENAEIQSENAIFRQALGSSTVVPSGGIVDPSYVPPPPDLLPRVRLPAPPELHRTTRHARYDNIEHYQDGIVIWQTPEDAKVPLLMRFNLNTQVRYLNTTSCDDTFTDHLGVVREVHKRNDITVNRTMFILGGYIFDERLRYSSTVWTSAGAASIVVAGNIGWQFNQGLTLTGGYTGVPGSRSLVNTFPFWTANDRSMADNFFRPGFTQGVWANGEPVKGLNYLAFVGNGLNTLNISANKIDTNLMFSGSVWWEPLGDYGPPGKSRNMYDDYFASEKTRIRLGTAFTRSREDRFSNLDQLTPDNTAMYNSDGVLLFSTGAFAPGVTVDRATYEMWAIDGGIKRNGLAINGQYFFRRVDDFIADGPLPLDFTYDHGFELSVSYFVTPKKLSIYGRGSRVFGQFGDSWEYAGGAKWYPVPTERMWLQAELMRVEKAPYSGAFTPYTSGLTGWVPMVQAILAF